MDTAESSTRIPGLITSGPEELAQNNPYKEGRIAPHAVYKSEDFRITELAFDAGVKLKEHIAPHPTIIQIALGTVEFTIHGKTHRMERGAMLHVAAGVAHEVTAVEPSRLLVTFLPS